MQTKFKKLISLVLCATFVLSNLTFVFAADFDQEIKSIVRQYPSKNVSVYYKDLTSGDEYVYNKDYAYENASLKKLPLYLYIYTLIKDGEMDPNMQVTYTSKDVYGGTGVINGMPYGTKFTVKDLLSKSIIYSDNVAFKMLQRTVNTNDYNKFIDTIGGKVSYYKYNIQNVAGYMNYLYKFMNENPKYRDQIMYDFTNTVFNDRIPAGIPDNIKVAHKIGSLDSSYHDAAIVFDEHPYILIIMTENGSLTNINKLFVDITEKVHSMHTDKYNQVSNNYFMNNDPITMGTDIIRSNNVTYLELTNVLEQTDIQYEIVDKVLKFKMGALNVEVSLKEGINNNAFFDYPILVDKNGVYIAESTLLNIFGYTKTVSSDASNWVVSNNTYYTKIK